MSSELTTDLQIKQQELTLLKAELATLVKKIDKKKRQIRALEYLIKEGK